MRTAVLLAGLLLTPTKYERAADRVDFPSPADMNRWAKKSRSHRRVVDLIRDRAVWAKAYEKIEGRLGLFNPKGRVRVILEATSDPRPALGGGRDGHGVVRFNMPRLVKYLDEVDTFEKLQAAGRIGRVVVPPMDFDGLICHELTHVLCGVTPDKWLTEGIASYAADDTIHLYSFNHRGSRVESLDLVVPDKDTYARGMAFFTWLEKKFGSGAVREFTRRVTFDEATPREAVEAVTGLSWRRATLLEKLWSAAYLRKFRR